MATKRKYEFKSGDVVFHKNLKEKGKFIAYAKLTDDECLVRFENEYDPDDIRRVSTFALELCDKK